MCINHLAYGFGELLFAYLFGESERKRNIVLNDVRIGLALGKYALLRKTERNALNGRGKSEERRICIRLSGRRFFTIHYFLFTIHYYLFL